jgi:hypothetical protein
MDYFSPWRADDIDLILVMRAINRTWDPRILRNPGKVVEMGLQ